MSVMLFKPKANFFAILSVVTCFGAVLAGAGAGFFFNKPILLPMN